MRVAIIGSGIAGLGAAWQLRNNAEVTIFEKNDRLGGHSHTITVKDKDGSAVAVDTGFIVYNEATYPNLVKLFDRLSIETIASDMSFAASLDKGRTEYASDDLYSLIGHWRNFFRVRHWRMLSDLIRFLKNGSALLAAPITMTLGDFLDRHRYSAAFRDDHLLPMAGAIWSIAPTDALNFPARSFGNFFSNHGLLELDTRKRPEWRTVKTGSHSYVKELAIKSGATIITQAAIETVTSSTDAAQVHFDDGTAQDFDHVIIATHADEALALLPNAATEMRDMLKAFRYSANDTYLHSDEALMPRRKRLWASWNYMRETEANTSKVFVSYWMNRLQSLDSKRSFFVTLNPVSLPSAEKTIAHQIYYHPQFNLDTIAAQAQLGSVQGKERIWLCGSYCGFGFHEDALASGLAVASALGAPREWKIADISPAFANATPRS